MTINGKEVTGNKFAYDGCHKIYVLETDEDEREAIEIGYEIHDISELKETYYLSCPLKFIESWSENKTYIPQCEEGDIEWKL